MASDPTTTSLMPAVGRGEASAFESLYDRYAPIVYARLLRMLARPEEAQEVLQETFVQAWSRAASYDASSGSEAAWLDAIARSGAIERLRAREVSRGETEEAARQEAAAIGDSLDPVDPPPEVREAVLAQTAGERTTTGAFRFLPAWTPTWWLAAAAATFLALFGWSELRYRAARENLAELQALHHSLEEENRRLTEWHREITSHAASLASPDTRTLSLAGQEAAPSASARVFVDGPRRRAIVFVHALPQNPGDKSYQLWVIRAGRPDPESAGVFDVDANGNARVVVERLPVESEIKALTVTLEPRGGVRAPTGAKYLAGS